MSGMFYDSIWTEQQITWAQANEQLITAEEREKKKN